MGTSTVFELGAVNVIVVCGRVKSGVKRNALTSVFCVGAYVIEVGFCMVCPVIVVSCAAVNGVRAGLVSFV